MNSEYELRQEEWDEEMSVEQVVEWIEHCPSDPTDELDGVNLYHQHYVICHCHKLKYFFYGDGAPHIYDTDTEEDVVYWEKTAAQLRDYQEVEFPLVPKA